MKTNVKLVAITLAALTRTGLFATAGESTKQIVLTAREAVLEQTRREAEIRAEAKAPGISRADFQRVMGVVNASKLREERETARYEKFKMDRQIALAQAAAPRISVVVGGAAPQEPETRRANYTRVSNASSYTKAAYGLVDRAFLSGNNPATAATEAPNRFYKRQALDRSGDRIVQNASDATMFAAQESGTIDTGTPFANPVQGRPGFVTSPPSTGGGMIDVRGYNPGSLARDPYTGQVFRVP